MISYNKLLLEPYSGDRKIKSTGEKQGFAQVSQRTAVIGLKLLVPATLTGYSDLIQAGSIIYFKEEDLYNSVWSAVKYTNDFLPNGFVIGDPTYVVCIKQTSNITECRDEC